MRTAFEPEGDIRGTDLLAGLVGLWRESGSGTLHFSRSGASAGFRLVSGEIVGVSSSEPRFETAAILLRAGKLDADTLERLATPEGADRARAAVQAGVLTRREWRWGEKIRAVEVLSDLLGWLEGDYVFERETPAPEGDFHLTVPRLVLELFLRSRDRNLVLHYLGGVDVPLARSRTFETEFATFGLTSDAETVVRLLDGKATAAEIASEAPADSFAVEKLLAALVTLGLVHPEFAAEALPPSPMILDDGEAAEAEEAEPQEREGDEEPADAVDALEEDEGEEVFEEDAGPAAYAEDAVHEEDEREEAEDALRGAPTSKPAAADWMDARTRVIDPAAEMMELGLPEVAGYDAPAAGPEADSPDSFDSPLDRSPLDRARPEPPDHDWDAGPEESLADDFASADRPAAADAAEVRPAPFDVLMDASPASLTDASPASLMDASPASLMDASPASLRDASRASSDDSRPRRRSGAGYLALAALLAAGVATVILVRQRGRAPGSSTMAATTPAVTDSAQVEPTTALETVVAPPGASAAASPAAQVAAPPVVHVAASPAAHMAASPAARIPTSAAARVAASPAAARVRPTPAPRAAGGPASATSPSDSTRAVWLDRAARDKRRLDLDRKTRFAIQLELACETGSLVDAWKHDRPAGTMWLLTSPYGDRTCFRVLWGRYPTREAARRAVAGTPAFFSTAKNRPIVVGVH